MNRFGDNKRSGYVTLLAVTFAFGLATLGTALAVSARSYLASATSRERVILDRISLESVAEQILADIAVKGERPLQSVQLEAVRINGRSITTELSIPETKVDLAMDDEATIRKAIPAFPNGTPVVVSGVHYGLEAWVRTVGFSASAEDCLRRRATFGRAPEVYVEPSSNEDNPDVARLAIADQVDLRLRLASGDAVLWMRTRFVGGVGRSWRTHDYRRLTGNLSKNCNWSDKAGLGSRSVVNN